MRGVGEARKTEILVRYEGTVAWLRWSLLVGEHYGKGDSDCTGCSLGTVSGRLGRA